MPQLIYKRKPKLLILAPACSQEVQSNYAVNFVDKLMSACAIHCGRQTAEVETGEAERALKYIHFC